MLIKQSSTAYNLAFLMIDSTDHISGKTGLTCTVTLSKNTAAFGAPAGAVTEIGNGWYKVAGNATDTNTLGLLLLHATAAAADATDMIVGEVVAFDPQDGVRAGLTALPNAAAGAANGLVILGTNASAISFTAGITISNAGGSALTISSSGSNGSGIIITANGTGDGIRATGGATGDGAKFNGGATSGHGIEVLTTSGDGLHITPTAGHAILATANGTSKHGMILTGGTAGTSDGLSCVAGTGGAEIRAPGIAGSLNGYVFSVLTDVGGNVNGNVLGSVASVAGVITLKKNTALANFPFRLTDSSDHISPKAGLGSAVTAQVALDGATTFTTLAGAVAEKTNGWYHVSLAAGETNGNTVALKFTGTGADQLDVSMTTQA